VPLHIYDETKVLENVRSDDWLTFGWPDDNIARNHFPTKIKETEAVRKLLDATVGQFKGYSSGRFDA